MEVLEAELSNARKFESVLVKTSSVMDYFLEKIRSEGSNNV